MTRIRSSLIVLFACLLVFTVAGGAQAAPGDLDPAFGTGGIATIASGADFDDAEPKDVAVAPDGKIVVVGGLAGPTNAYAFIIRLLPNGARDQSFGADGLVLTRLGPDLAEFTSVVVQADGRIVVGGAVRNTGVRYATVARYTGAGELDQSFSAAGGMPGVLTNTGLSAGNSAVVQDLAMRPNGSFVATGGVSEAQRIWFTESITSIGQPDFGFNGTGHNKVAFFNQWAESSAIVARPDGRAVACGYAAASSSGTDTVNDAFISFTTVGSFDGQFNGFGTLIRPDAATQNRCLAMALQSDGKIATASFSTDGSSSSRMLLSRLNANGTPDVGFADGGQYIDDRSEPVSFPAGLVIQPSGRILAVGRGRIAGVNGYSVWARLPSGAADPSFGANGFVHIPSGGGWASGAALFGDQRLFMVGTGAGDLRVLSVKLQPDVPAAILPSSARAKITSPSKAKLKRSKLKSISGTATAVNGTVGSVEVAILKSGKRKSKKCLWLMNNKAKFRKVTKTRSGCKRQVWLKANGTSKWKLKLKKSLPVGKYTIYARATPIGGTPEAAFSKALRNSRALKLIR